MGSQLVTQAIGVAVAAAWSAIVTFGILAVYKAASRPARQPGGGA